MAFAFTTSDFALQEDTLLVAWLRKDEDIWVQSRIDLNEHIGSYNGEFDVASSGWFGWSRPGSSYLQGTVLFAQLMRPDGSWGPRTSIDLNLFIKNDNGTLKFQKLHESITVSSACLNLNNSTLQGLCFGYDGKLHYSDINLDDHYGNIEGRIESGSSHLFKTGDEFQLCPSPSEVRLRGHLRCHPRWRPRSRRLSNHTTWNNHDINLAHSIVNGDGKLEFTRRAQKIDTKSETATLLKDSPRVGYIPGGAELVPGNEDRVAEAIAECTSSSIAAIGILVGAAVGTIIGNTMIGLAIGTGMTAPGGISPEIESLVTCINDPLILVRSLEASIGRYIYRVLRNLLSPNATDYFVAFMTARMEPKIDEIGNVVLDCLGMANMSRGAGISLETAIMKAMDALCKQKIPEWSDLDIALQMIRSQQLDYFQEYSSF
ncbi:hypothetical protein TWF192_003238 [Orbilia oligospora]|uniref:Cyanovirin-N domain-containing protein n=1 Tax=Orbilia oligospora TaxID=2813651 RepID=A0A6G1MD17_ORBOL|nr:hypothetical protein TWF679_006870 [Orbilia oligospora]KAF3225320.1 hypothetical protein TWF191_005371 [Orbilia oligospora]KAF3254477.1 hypothetical protein TWF192_003238 [Orbilia oligospora]